jgi:sortase (surface protein transpeptidase)
VHLRVPSIGVDAPVVPVGLTPIGEMELPPASQVGWYRLGPRPGALGSAVLAAHIDFGGQAGAFYALPALQLGAEVVVTEPPGVERRFVVTTREQIAKTEIDLARYFTRDGPARLVLITCGGVFDTGAGHYADNIVVTAVPAA